MLYWVKEDTLFCAYFCMFLFSITTSNVKMFYLWLIYIPFFFFWDDSAGRYSKYGEKENSYYQIAVVSVSFCILYLTQASCMLGKHYRRATVPAQ